MATIENVPGSELKTGDLIWNAGYLWRVLETKYEAYTLIHDPEVRRWCVTCEWSGIGTDPKFFNDNITFARREDLAWPRSLDVQDGIGANRVAARIIQTGLSHLEKDVRDRLGKLRSAADHLARSVLSVEDACHPDFQR